MARSARKPSPFGDLDPRLRSGEFVFVDGEDSASVSLGSSEIEASIRESDGLSLVVRREIADREGLTYGFVAAWIEIGLQTDLDLVGLTAWISNRLSEAGISCNVVAGLRHDHLLVPLDKARATLELLR